MWFLQKVRRPLVLSYSSKMYPSTYEWFIFLSKHQKPCFWDILGPLDLAGDLVSKIGLRQFSSCKNQKKLKSQF